MYLSIPKEDRLKHNMTIKAIPNFYLNRVICEIHEDLLKDLEKVHLKGLNTMLDHQKFIEQRINAEQTWNIDTKD